MKTTLHTGIIGGLLLIQSLVYAGDNHTITPKLGSYNLDSTSQTINGSPSTFEESSGSFGVEYQYNLTDNMSIGGGLDIFEHSYTRVIDGDMETLLALFNFKYNFPVTDWFHPYIGVSAGAAVITMSGSLIGTASDTAFGLIIGTKFPISQSFGIGIEYRKINAEVSAEVLGGGTADIDASGNALTANLSITF